MTFSSLPAESSVCESISVFRRRDGVFELRIDAGPGFRVYYAVVGKAVILLLYGGDKKTQASDIARALDYLRDFKERTQ